MSYTFCGVARGMYCICKREYTPALVFTALWIYDSKIKPGLSSLVQILHHLTPGSEGDGSFNNLFTKNSYHRQELVFFVYRSIIMYVYDLLMM